MLKLINQDDLLKKLGIKRAALWALRKNKGFPEPVLKYPSRYSLEAINEWVNKGGVSKDS
ncbi:hypothetical protein RCS94_06695 [Orbaceae bacterium ac157xtp]